MEEYGKIFTPEFTNWLYMKTDRYKPFIVNQYSRFLNNHNNTGLKYKIYGVYDGIAVEIIVAVIKIKNEFYVKPIYFETDTDIQASKFLYYCYSGYQVDWTDEGKKRRFSYYYLPKSKTDAWELGKCNISTENGDYKVIQANNTIKEIPLVLDKYKYSAIDNENFKLPNKYSVMDYLSAYKNNPKLELMQKAGLGYFINSKKIIKKCNKDKRFLNYMKTNADYFTSQTGINWVVFCYGNYYNIPFKYVDKIYTSIYWRIEDNREQVIKVAIENYSRIFDYIKTNRINLTDYLEFLSWQIQLKKNLADTKELYPNSFVDKHEYASKEYNSYLNAIKIEKAKQINDKILKVAEEFKFLETEINGYKFILAKSITDLQHESDIQHICVGYAGYDDKIANDVSLIVFCRKNSDTPLVCIEVIRETGKVLQARAEYNKNPDSQIQKVIDTWNKKTINKILKINKELKEVA